MFYTSVFVAGNIFELCVGNWFNTTVQKIFVAVRAFYVVE